MNLKEEETKKEELNLNESIEEDVQEVKEEKEKEEIEKKDKEQNKGKKYVLYLGIILVITIAVLCFNLLSDTNILSEDGKTYLKVYQTFPMIFEEMNYGYFAFTIFIIIFSLMLNGFILFCFARLYTKRYRYHQAMANLLIGDFYQAITPGGVGGHFAQVYTFKKQEINISVGTSIVVMIFIVYQTVLLICGFISMFKIGDILAINTITLGAGESGEAINTINIPLVIFVIAGYLLNAIVILALIFMSYSRRLHNFVINKGIRFLGKLHLIKDPDKKREELTIKVANYRVELRRLQTNIPFTILVSVLTFGFIFFSGAIPALCGYSLNAFIETNQFDVLDKCFTSFCYYNFHQMTCGLLPIPGMSGISEFVFAKLYTVPGEEVVNPFFTNPEFVDKGGLPILLLLWRIGTFYIPFLVDGLIAALYKSRGLRGESRFYNISNPRQTFLTIQIETYEERKTSSDTRYVTVAMERKQLLHSLSPKGRKEKKQKKIEDQAQNIKKNEENINSQKTTYVKIGNQEDKGEEK